jgi:hypothetical protein
MNRFHTLPTYATFNRKDLLRTSWEMWAKDYRATIASVVQKYADECQAGGEVQKMLEVSQTNWEGVFLKPYVPPKVDPGDNYDSGGE